MKKLIALVLALTFGATLLAKDLTYTACTSDKKVAALAVTIADDAPATVEAEVKTAFEDAAKGLTAEAPLGREGFLAFVAGLTDEARDNMALSGPPVLTGDNCK